MGMFDSVMVSCPKCTKPVEFQSKEWDCTLEVWSLETAPTPVLHDIMNDPRYCEACGNWFALIDPGFPPGPPPRPKLTAANVVVPDNPITHFQGMKWWPDSRAFTYADLVTPFATLPVPEVPDVAATVQSADADKRAAFLLRNPTPEMIGWIVSHCDQATTEEAIANAWGEMVRELLPDLGAAEPDVGGQVEAG